MVDCLEKVTEKVMEKGTERTCYIYNKTFKYHINSVVIKEQDVVTRRDKGVEKLYTLINYKTIVSKLSDLERFATAGCGVLTRLGHDLDRIS